MSVQCHGRLQLAAVAWWPGFSKCKMQNAKGYTTAYMTVYTRVLPALSTSLYNKPVLLAVNEQVVGDMTSVEISS